MSRPIWLVVGISALIFAAFSFLRPADAIEQKIAATNSLHPVEVFQSDASARSLSEAFALAGVEYYPEDRITAFPNPSLGLGSVITVERALPIALKDGKRSYLIRTWQSTVGELLNEKKITLMAEDRISPSLATPLQINLPITITRVARTTVVETEVIQYQTIIEKDYTQFVGASTVLTSGKNGEKQNTYLVIREDGDLISKTLTGSVVTIQSQTARVRQGGLNPVSSKCAQYKDWVVDASLKNKIDPNALFYRMQKESNCNPNSIASAGYQGLLQYDPVLWVTLSAKAGLPGASIWDAKSQIYVTAWAWANGHRSRWPNP